MINRLVLLVAVGVHVFAQGPPKVTTLYDFSYPAQLYNPVVIGSGGVLYGTTFGGVSCCGTVFSLSPPSSPGGSWNLTTLYSFTGGEDGSLPSGPVAIGDAGVLYGATLQGGNDFGTVFSLMPPTSPGGAWTEKVLYSFGRPNDGAPSSGVTIGPNNVLYGTTVASVYSLMPPSSSGGAWTFELLHAFKYLPYSGVVIGQNGALYGTTGYGGSTDHGMVYVLQPPSSPGGSWTEGEVYSFMGGSDGADPVAGVVIGPGGVLYGTTYQGGNYSCSYANGCGTVFRLVPPASPGGAWTETILHTFTGGNDGANPQAGVTIGQDGVLFGTTEGGGANGGGTVFALIPPSSAGEPWTETVLYSFSTNVPGMGWFPEAGVAIGSGGTLYGTTVFDGSTTSYYCAEYGCGTVFSLTR